jgi:hypothetical protein
MSKLARFIICMKGFWAKECKDSVKFTVKNYLPSNEKPLGEWNAKNGYFGFQNESVPLEFKKLLIY